MKRLFAAGYWGPRVDELNQIADNIIFLKQMLESQNSIFKDFYIPGSSKSKVYSKPALLSVESIVNILRQRILKDDYGNIMQGGGTGYKYITNEIEKNSAWILSGKVNSQSHHIINNCILEFEAKQNGMLDLTTGFVHSIFECLSIWNPEYISFGIDRYYVISEVEQKIKFWRNFTWISQGLQYSLPENFIEYKKDSSGVYITSLDSPLRI